MLGYIAEYKFQNLIVTDPRIKKWNYPSSRDLIKIANKSNIGRDRLRKAYKDFKSKYGISYLNKESGLRCITFNWEDVPPQEIIDYVFGLDFILCTRGYKIGIDITLNKEDLISKKTKLRDMRKLNINHLGLDRVAVLLFNPNLNKESLWDKLIQITKTESILIV